MRTRSLFLRLPDTLKQRSVLPFQIDGWSINPKSGVAQRDDEKVRLEPKACELLCYLVMRRGDVVSREELLQAVWPDVVVGDEVITNAVAKLRRSLRDDPKVARLIETVPKRGYRLVATVSGIPEADDSKGKFRPVAFAILLIAVVSALLFGVTWIENPGTVPTGQAPLLLPEKPSIAVLPFINLSGDRGQEYFVDGLTEDLITDLSQVSGLFVIARNSSFAYKGKQVSPGDLRQELGVGFFVEGSVRKLESSLRVNIKLIDTSTGGHLWAKRYDTDIDRVFDIQDQITDSIVTALSVKVTEIEKAYTDFKETYDRKSYDSFLKGWSEYQRKTPESFARAIKHFENAVREDPAYGRALAALSAIYWEAYQKLWYRRLAISPRSLAWQRANEYLRRSMVAPTPLAHKVASSMLMTNRRFDEALAEAKRAIAIDANDPTGFVAMADILIFAGKPEEAEPLIQNAMRIDPKAKYAYLFTLGKVQLVKGQLQEAIATLEAVTQQQPDDRLVWMALISAYGLSGKAIQAEVALKALNELQRKDKIVSFTIANAREHWPFKEKSDRARFLSGLRMAGVPEW